jgi:hypothetical protein
MLSLLAECTILTLSILCELYWKQKITNNEFRSLTEIKIMFLSDMINQLDSETETQNIKDIIGKCTSILSESGDAQVADVNCAHLNPLQ